MAVLPKPHRKAEGYIEAANGDCVSWCIGHLLELAEPDAYNPNFKKWRYDDLPIIPDRWQLQVKAATGKQFRVLETLVARADELVHAGDPDREGQLLVDELFAYLQISKARRQTLKRLLISDLNPAAVQRALASMRDNHEFAALSTSALARSRADWLYGINMTRAYTLKGQAAGHRGVLSVGRVQTPLLGLVVRRDLDIEHFVAKPFFEVMADVQTDKGEQFSLKWKPSKACEDYQDDEGRVLSRGLAENVIRRIAGKPGKVIELSQKQRREAPPLPFNLSALQIEAARYFALTAQQVLETCQTLYERHRLITYPRSDSRHLPEEHFAQRAATLAVLRANIPALSELLADASPEDGEKAGLKPGNFDPDLQSKAWDDSKVDAHHAIVPTQKRMQLSQLNDNERRIYLLLVRNYLLQFYPDYRYRDTRVAAEIEGGRFEAQAQQGSHEGWKGVHRRFGEQLFARKSSDAERSDTEMTHGADTRRLPGLKKGQALTCLQGRLLERRTTAPKPFTDASLLAAMTGVARFVSDPALKKILRETDGLGTEATRAGILELLFRRGFLHRQGRRIHATTLGRQLIASLPEVAVLPDMTARWESSLEAISQGAGSYTAFMADLQSALQELIRSGRTRRLDIAASAKHELTEID